MYKIQKEIRAIQKMFWYVSVTEFVGGIALIGIVYFTKGFVHQKLHLFYFLFFLGVYVYAINPIPKTRNKKVYNVYFLFLKRIKSKIGEKRL